jgi:hypothetical protein
MYPYVAPHTAKIHTLITLVISIRTKPHVLKARKHLPRGFDSHRPPHSRSLTLGQCCPRWGTRAVVRFQNHDATPALATRFAFLTIQNRILMEDQQKSNLAGRLRLCASFHQLLRWTGQSTCLTILPIVRTGDNQNGIRNNYQ